ALGDEKRATRTPLPAWPRKPINPGTIRPLGEVDWLARAEPPSALRRGTNCRLCQRVSRGRGDALHAGGDRNWRQTHAPHHALRFAEEPGRTRVAATARQGIARRGRGVVSRTGLDSIVSQFSTEFPDWCCAPAPMGLVYERIVNYRGGVRIERPI